MGKANGRKNQLPCKPDEIVEGSTADDESETFVAVQESEDRPEEKDLHPKLTTWKKSSQKLKDREISSKMKTMANLQ